MGQISNALLLERGLRTEFSKALKNGEQPSDVMGMVMETKSNAADEKYGWLGEVPMMTEWLDERKLQGLPDFDYTIPNRDYEATLKVPKNALDDDQLGAINLRIRDLTSRGMLHPRKLFFDALVAGTVDLCYDGVPFFSNSHLESGSAQDNLGAGTISSGTYTAAEFKTAFCDARAAMRGFVDNQGEPRNEGEMQLTVVASADLECVLDEVFTASMLNNSTNTLKGAAKKLISSRLSGNDFYILDSSGNMKPLILQKRQALKFEAHDKNTSEAFMRKDLMYGVDSRTGFGYGVWYKAYKVVGSV